MKHALTKIILGASLIPALGFTRSIMPTPTLEPVNVLSIVNKGNFMPPVRPGYTGESQISIRVASGGCTTEQDFTVASYVKNGTETLTFIRTNPDPCEAYLPEGVKLTFTKKGIVSANVVVANPQFIIDKTTH